MAKTLLIGWDGGTFDLLEPFWENGTMPFLKSFVDRGVRATLRSGIPDNTYAMWPSIATGRSPSHHGILDFSRVTRDETGYIHTSLATATDVRCETLWSIASRQGRQVGVLNWPVSFPPIEGPSVYLVPGFVGSRHLRAATRPRGFYEEIASLPGFKAQQLGFDMDAERKAIQDLEKEKYESWIRFHILREERWLDVARLLLCDKACELVAVVFDGPDKLQHLCWRFIDLRFGATLTTSWERGVNELCKRYYRRLDEILADLVALAGPDARVIIASDHGFGPSEELFYINTWLEQQGYLRWAPAVPFDSIGKMAMDESTRSATVLFDWPSTKACALSAGSNGIFINVTASPSMPGVRPEEYHAFREQLKQKLLAFTDPSGKRVVTRVYTREEAFPGPMIMQAPDLTLELRDSGFFSILRAEHPFRKRSEVMGTHHPEGIFMAAGPGIKPGLHAPELSILDVAPLVLYSLGLSIPSDFEGQLPLAILEDQFVQANPPRVGAPNLLIGQHYTPLEPKVQEVVEDPQIIQRLRALGYLE
ncbi:MAG: alkaline phosphatase family protein [Chromatiales bacterium]